MRGSRYFVVTLCYCTDAYSYTEAVASGMACTAIAQFCILDQETGEVETLYYSHRRHKLEYVDPLPETDETRLIIEAIAKHQSLTTKFVKRFSDNPKLRREDLNGVIDDFNDM